MAKGKKCVLYANNRWGYVYTHREFPSIAQAVKEGCSDYGVFRWDVCVDGKVVRSGYGADYRCTGVADCIFG